MNVAGAFIDNRRLAVAQVALNRIVVRITVGAVDFDGHRRGLFAAHGCLPFRQAGRAAAGLAFVLQPARAQPKQPRHLIVGLHLGNLLFDELMIRDLGTEGFALVGVGHGRISRRANNSRGAGGDGESSLL